MSDRTPNEIMMMIVYAVLIAWALGALIIILFVAGGNRK